MEKYRYGLFAILLFGLFYFSEGKPCPERTRPHKSRCDAYYKCTELPNKHVWVPARCEEGLIYEHSLGVCVLPADDWECSMGDNKNKKSQNQNQPSVQNATNNKDADLIIVSNADDEENYINSKFDDGRVEIIIGTEDRDEDNIESGEDLYDGSGNGGELVELEGFMQAETRETLDAGINHENELKKDVNIPAMEKKEELEEMLQTIKIKADLQQPSTNIDPKLTAHLQRLSQLIDGLKQTYQTPPDVKPQDINMRPDQLNAFLAHFNIKSKFDKMDPNDNIQEVDIISGPTNAPKSNRTLDYKTEYHNKLGPETKVVLNNLLPQRYRGQHHDNSNTGGDYSNSQIVVNRPEGSVLFTLPSEHHFIERPEYSSVNSPKISEETLKTVLELSKQMIASQNVPKVIPNPSFYAPSIMQPILLTPNLNSPFSSNYFGQSPNGQLGGGSGFSGPFSSDQGDYNQNYKYKKPTKRPHNNNGAYDNDKNNNGYGNDNHGYGNGHGNNGYGNGHGNNDNNDHGNNGHGNNDHGNNDHGNNGYGNNDHDNNGHGNNGYGNNDHDNNGHGNNGYGNYKPATTIIHNNVIPVHVSNTGSGEKEVLDSYGQSLGLYPPIHHHEDNSDLSSQYQDRPNANAGYSSGYQHNKYSHSTTKRPSYGSVSTTASSSYHTTPSPYDFQPTSATLNQYFTPSEHLNEHNVNQVFQSTDNYGNIPRPMKGKRPNLQIYKPSQVNINHQDGYSSSNSLFPQIDSHKVHIRPNSQKFESMEMDNEESINNYNEDQESQAIRYTYGNSRPEETNLQQQYSETQYSAPSSSLYGESGLQQNSPSSINSMNSVFSTAKNPYMPRPQSNIPTSISTSNTYSGNSKNKYSSLASPISSSSYGEGAQLVNVGGNFISYDVFQNSILPLMGGSQNSLSSSLNNIEVITCAAGIRQPNSTDCTRYYVCSKKDGKVLSYSCPPFTAFNNDNRICDAKTYAHCNPESVVPTYSVTENKRIQMETLKALQDAKRRQNQQQQQQQQEAVKAQNFVNLLNQYSSSTGQSQTNQDSSEQNMLESYMQQAASMSNSYTTTSRPATAATTAKKRKYYCKEGDKIPDQTSISNYFVCYKNAQGQMKGHKMTCSKSLLFCPKSTMCTLPSKCS